LITLLEVTKISEIIKENFIDSYKKEADKKDESL
jgi:hypothetical protein